MNVKQLKAEIADLPDDYEVVMSSDGEGNDFSPLAQLDLGFYDKTSSYSGEFTGEDDEPEEVNAVCLWPTN